MISPPGGSASLKEPQVIISNLLKRGIYSSPSFRVRVSEPEDGVLKNCS